MPNSLSSPNMLIVYDFSDMVGQYRAVVELVGGNATYPKGWDGVPADVYFSFDPDEARDSDEPSASLAEQMKTAGYDVDASCSTGEIGAVLHVACHVDEDNVYTIYTKSGDNRWIYDDELFSIGEGLDNFENMPVAWQHDWWYISECY